MSQILSFHTYDDISREDVIEAIRSSPASRDGSITVFDCQRVPRKFHSLFLATWRRYMYMFPLNVTADHGADQEGWYRVPPSCMRGFGEGSLGSLVDVDVEFINRALER